MTRISIAMVDFLHTTAQDKCNNCDGITLITANESEFCNFRGVTRIRSNARYADF